MASPTRSSAGSPTNMSLGRAAPPGLAIKTTTTQPTSMAAIAPNGVVPAMTLGPKKEWVIPPRPKPGRKPATDTPPTKRKAQNRAAQRAFRERRAARVGELEEQLKETEEERLKRESAMQEDLSAARSEITRLETEVRRFVNEAVEWRGRYEAMEQKYNFERKDKESVVAELAYLRNGARSTGTSAVPLPPRRQKAQKSAPTPQILTPNEVVEPLGCGNCTTTGSCECIEQAMKITTSGCGRCTPGGHCECLEETLNSTGLDSAMDIDSKRPASPSTTSYEAKRPRLSVEVGPQEIDFTTQFSSKSKQTRQMAAQEAPPILRQAIESCGFCTDGTYCMCAEALASNERENDNRLPPLLSEVTPPPSENDFTTAETVNFKLPSLHPNHRVHHAVSTNASQPSAPLTRAAKKKDSCVNGPGTCQQCQDDPKSGLFCRSLAAMRASGMGPEDGGCCGGNTSGGGCCKTNTSADRPQAALSCADTYKTLSTHKKFDQASDELGNWLPKLLPTTPRYPGRGALDIEAASVMNVIKYFDVRFGRD